VTLIDALGVDLEYFSLIVEDDLVDALRFALGHAIEFPSQLPDFRIAQRMPRPASIHATFGSCREDQRNSLASVA
jgi:hypothetical protein